MIRGRIFDILLYVDDYYNKEVVRTTSHLPDVIWGDLRTFERIHNTEEQIYFYERAENHKAMSGCLNHSNEGIFQVNILMQGRIKDSWKGGSYA